MCTEKTQKECYVKAKDWIDAATSHDMTKTTGKPPDARREVWVGSLSQLSKGSNPADTLISDFKTPKL